jgi:hypothetical protein
MNAVETHYIKKGRKYIPIALLTLDTDDRILLNCAFRYALGRMTYVVGSIVEQLIKAYPVLNIHDRIRIAKEIEEAINEGHAGWDCDVKEWKRVMYLFRDENHVKVQAYKVAKGAGRIEDGTKDYTPIEVSGEFDVVDAVKMDGKYYSLDMEKYYHTVKEINDKGEQ